MSLESQVVVTTQIAKTLEALEAQRINETFVEIVTPSVVEESSEETPLAPFVHRIVTQKSTFSVQDASLAIEKAHMASDEHTIIILADKLFSPLVQNRLLKVIEEPPANKSFILLTESKATILDTIKSRLPVTVLSERKEEEALSLDVRELTLGSVYAFVQEHKRTDAKEMSYLLERIVTEAIASQQYDLDEKSLKLFGDSYVALDMGSPPQFVLNTLLLKLLARKKR